MEMNVSSLPILLKYNATIKTTSEAQSTCNMLWFVLLEFIRDEWQEAHWGTVKNNNNNNNNLFTKPKKSGNLKGKRKWCGSAAVRMLGSQVRIPMKACIFVSLHFLLCCASCRDLPLWRADQRIPTACLYMCELKISTTRRPRPELGCCVKNIA
jgi:hypothetical protein